MYYLSKPKDIYLRFHKQNTKTYSVTKHILAVKLTLCNETRFSTKGKNLKCTYSLHFRLAGCSCVGGFCAFSFLPIFGLESMKKSVRVIGQEIERKRSSL